MYYYHGSHNLFSEFYLSASNHNGTIFLTPSKEVAKIYALNNPNSSGYVYTINVKGQEDIKFIESMSTQSFRSTALLTILDVEKV